MAMVYLSLFTMLAVTFSGMSSSGVQVAANQRRVQKAYLAAESGLQVARDFLLTVEDLPKTKNPDLGAEDLDAVWAQSLSDEDIEWSYGAVLHHLALLDIGIKREHLLLDDGYSCVYSLTESEVPYVTHAPGEDGRPDPNLVVVGGMSGVGAKGALGYGVIAADLLLDRTEADPVYLAAREAFGFERMQKDTRALSR